MYVKAVCPNIDQEMKAKQDLPVALVAFFTTIRTDPLTTSEWINEENALSDFKYLPWT